MPETEPVEFQESHAAGEGYDAGKGDGREIADDAIQEWSDQQHGVDPTGIEASPRLVDGFRRLLIRRFILEHVGGSWADYEDMAAEDAAESSFPSLKFQQGQQQFTSPEVRPERRGKIELCIGQLPEEKITDARFAAGADEQIGVGQVMRVQILLNVEFIDILRLKLPVLSLANQSSARRPRSLNARHNSARP